MAVKQLIAGKHSCVGHLSAGGALDPSNKARLEKPAMLVYCGVFQSMDGEVEIEEHHIDKLIANHNGRLTGYAQMSKSTGEIERNMPPLQVDHSTSAHDTVGRVVGTLSKGTHTLPAVEGNEELGIEAVLAKDVPCLLVDKVIVLGAENTEKVADGRWVNLSIGADLESCTLNEVSITPFPAAAHAALLSKRKRLNDWEVFSKGTYKGFPYQIETDDNKFYGYCDNAEFDGQTGQEVMNLIKAHVDAKPPKANLSEGEGMHEKLKKHLMEKYQMSEEKAEEHLSKMKGHLAKKLAADEAKADEHMASMSDEDAHKLADDVHEEEKSKLAAEETGKEEEKKKEEKMAAARAQIITLSKGIRKGITSGRLTSREQGITARISRLRSCRKMTPAEQKKINLTELSKKSDSELKSFFDGFEIREDVIDSRIIGTTRALTLGALSRMSKDKQKIRLEAEARQDMGMPMTDEQKKEMEGAAPHMSEEPKLSDSQGHDEMLKHLEGMLSSYDQRDAVMAHVKKMMEMKHMGEMAPEHAESVEKQMSALAENFNRLQTEFQDLITLVGETSGIQSADLKD